MEVLIGGKPLGRPSAGPSTVTLGMDEPVAIPVLPAGPFYRAPRTVQTTLAVKPTPDGPARKVTKIISYREGGFGLLAPYHKAKQGFVTKTMVD